MVETNYGDSKVWRSASFLVEKMSFLHDSVGFDSKKLASSNLRYDCLLNEQWTFRGATSYALAN